MPQLKCMVKTCAHNQNCLCDLDRIMVGGKAASRKEETCCDSFQEIREGYSNSGKDTKPATETSDVSCQACDCVYNRSCYCQAGQISVKGSGACSCSQTECATFSCK